MPEILGIIPARANSKRVPGKNLRLLNGKPLVQYAIDASLHSNLFSIIVVSSDSREILDLAKTHGNKIIVIERPDKYATDDSPAIEYVQHALEYLKQSQGKQFDYVAIIQPSSPLTKGNDIDNTIQLMLDYDAECGVSIREVPYDLHPSKYLFLKNNKIESFLNETQIEQIKNEEQKFYVRNGSVYVSSIKLIREGKLLSQNCAAYIMPAERSVDINDEMDLLLAEFLLKRQMS
jgi:CMP-N-acetylneuraminic acid synthetase